MKRKTKRAPDSENLKLAVEKVVNREMSIREASERYNIPKSTLFDNLKLLKKGEEAEYKPAIGKFQKTFSDEHEYLLECHAKEWADRCRPLTKTEFLKISYELAEKLKLPHKFNNEKRIAGRRFYEDFIKRHPNLILRTKETTSLMHAAGFSKKQVENFFTNLQKLLDT